MIKILKYLKWQEWILIQSMVAVAKRVFEFLNKEELDDSDKSAIIENVNGKVEFEKFAIVGNHNQLLEKGGVYKELYTSQFENGVNF